MSVSLSLRYTRRRANRGVAADGPRRTEHSEHTAGVRVRYGRRAAAVAVVQTRRHADTATDRRCAFAVAANSVFVVCRCEPKRVCSQRCSLIRMQARRSHRTARQSMTRSVCWPCCACLSAERATVACRHSFGPRAACARCGCDLCVVCVRVLYIICFCSLTSLLYFYLCADPAISDRVAQTLREGSASLSGTRPYHLLRLQNVYLNAALSCVLSRAQMRGVHDNRSYILDLSPAVATLSADDGTAPVASKALTSGIHVRNSLAV